MAAACAVALVAGGCSVVPPTEGVQPIDRVASNEAYVTPEGGGECRTPCRIDLATMPEAFDLRIRAAGFEVGRVVIRHFESEWNADITNLGTTPCLAIDVAAGVVRRTDFAELQRVLPDAAVALGVPTVGQLSVVAVTRGELAGPVVTVLARE